MSDEEPRSARLIDWLARHRLRCIGAAVALAAVLVLLNGWLLNPSRLPPTSPKGRTTAPGPEVGPESIAALLRKGNDLAVCRNVVRQFNAAQVERPALTDEELSLLRHHFRSLMVGDGLDEIRSISCTPLDAHYLESCFLFADAARALQVAGQPERVQASAAFNWVVRQVRLQETDEAPGPPAAVLRRGWGGDRERALVFLALLDQLRLPGCMFYLQPWSARLWIPGVLADGDILLFDTRLGAPLPGVAGQDSATLAQLCSHPELLKPLADLNYDVTPEEAAKVGVMVACPLSALAPRMRVLENLLKESQPARLSADPQRLLQQYQQAAERAGLAKTDVFFWDSLKDDHTPLRCLRTFLPPAEGGGDRTRERQPRFNGTVIPWSALPAIVESVPSEVELGARLRDQFARPFLDFTLNSRLPRDLMLRGQLDEAVGLLVETLDRVQEHQRTLKAQPGMQKSFSDWCLEARKAQEDWLLARGRARTPEGALAVKSAEERFLAVWRQGELPPEKDGRREGPAPLEYLHGQAGMALSVEAAYWLALAKQEQAELLAVQHQRQLEKIDRDAVQAAWRAAADRWRKYRADYPTPAAAPAALGLARCLEALGERDAALAAVESLATAPRGWNKSALELRVRQLKAR